MSPPDLGVSLRPNGLRVDLNPNAVELHVACGPEGAVLTMHACGLTISAALPGAARSHLIKLLTDSSSEIPPDGAAPVDPPTDPSRAAVAGSARGVA